MYTVLESTKVLTAGTASYTIGASGSINTTRPTDYGFSTASGGPVDLSRTSAYAQRYGLDLSTSYTINTLGPNDEEWAAGSRGFACVLGRL